MTAPTKRFRVALSYASASPERFAYVRQVADHLAEAFSGPTQILYDKFHEAELSRPDLDEHLLPLYRDHSDLMVVFLDEQYERSQWCGIPPKKWTPRLRCFSSLQALVVSSLELEGREIVEARVPPLPIVEDLDPLSVVTIMTHP